MDCKNSQNLIVDYFLDDLDEVSKETLLDHLQTCSECRGNYVKYKELLSISRVKDTENSPRFEIIDRLQQIARINSNKDEPRWKKFLQIPVLVPVISVTMAIMIFFNIETNTFDKVASLNEPQNEVQVEPLPLIVANASDSIDYSQQMLIGQQNQEESTETKKPGSVNTEFDSNLVVRSDFSPNFRKKVLISKIDDDFSIVSKAKSQFINEVDSKYFRQAPTQVAKAEEVMVEEERVKANDEKPMASSPVVMNDFSLKEDIVGKELSFDNAAQSLEVASAGNNRSQMLSLRIGDAENKLSDEKNEISKSPTDTDGFCDEKIEENINLLEDNEISFDKKKGAYITLAECYELKRNWQKAVDNYISLKAFDGEGRIDYQKKIDFIVENHIER